MHAQEEEGHVRTGSQQQNFETQAWFGSTVVDESTELDMSQSGVYDCQNFLALASIFAVVVHQCTVITWSRNHNGQVPLPCSTQSLSHRGQVKFIKCIWGASFLVITRDRAQICLYNHVAEPFDGCMLSCCNVRLYDTLATDHSTFAAHATNSGNCNPHAASRYFSQ